MFGTNVTRAGLWDSKALTDEASFPISQSGNETGLPRSWINSDTTQETCLKTRKTARIGQLAVWELLNVRDIYIYYTHPELEVVDYRIHLGEGA